MQKEREIIGILKKMEGRYAMYEIFSDWIRCFALAISNACRFWQDAIWKQREQQYIDTMKKYNTDEQNMIAEMCACLTEALEEEMGDVLGTIFMESGMGSKGSGQFFSPYSVSRMVAELELADREPEADGKIHLNEPSCGGGGMIIATASALKKRGFDYQRKLEVVAQDLDWRAVYMCYVQLSLLGIRAICVQGDTLSEPYIPGRTGVEHILYTPAKAGVLI